MTALEFKTWWQNFARLFPETAAWVNGLGEGKPILLQGWQSVLADVESQDGHTATMRLLSGQEEPIAAYDREKTPAVIRRIAMDLQRQRTATGEAYQENIPAPVRGGKPFPVTRLLADLSAATDRGASQDERQQIIAEFKAEFCTPMADYEGPRFYCATCRDSGFVLCWDGRAVAAMRDGGIAAVRSILNPLAGFLCTCKRGQRKTPGPMDGIGRYDVMKCFICPRGDAMSEENLLAFERDYEAGRKSKRNAALDEYQTSF